MPKSIENTWRSETQMMDSEEQQLRTLVEEWREKADTLYDIYKRHEIDNLGELSQVELLADELERTLNECYGDDE